MRFRATILFFLFPVWLYGQKNNVVNDASDGILRHSLFENNQNDLSADDSTSSDFLYQHNENLFLSLVSDFRLWNFSERGLSPNRRMLYINGLQWNLPEDGALFFKNLTALYGNSRLKAYSGLEGSRKVTGGFDGTTEFSLSPFSYPKSYSVKYGFGNGDYRQALALSYRSGKLRGDWSLTVDATHQWASESYVPGTYRYTTAFSASAGKKTKTGKQFILSLLGNFYRGANASAITRELARLSGDYQYNPNWGYQNGRKRNASTTQTFLPALIFQYKNRTSPVSGFDFSFAYQTGLLAYGSPDWFRATNPDADYYKKLPSYYYLQGGDFNHYYGDFLTAQWKLHPNQLDWQNFYIANRMNRQTRFPDASLYVLSTDTKKPEIYRAAFRFFRHFPFHLNMNIGLQGAFSRTDNYSVLDDLLGGKYYLNLNQFAFRSFGQHPDWEQYDLRHPDRKVVKGEKYNYHYLSEARKGNLWLTLDYQYQNFQLWLDAAVTYTAFQRNGLYQNGVFELNSYGKSGWQKFCTNKEKIGMIYHFNTNHYLQLVGYRGTVAPAFDHVFFAPRYRNTVVQDLRPEMIQAVELSWYLKNKRTTAEIALFRSEISHQTDVRSFYHDDYNSFVHLVLKNISSAQTGIELAFRWQPFHFLTLSCMASMMQAFYDGRPSLNLYRDNDTALINGTETVFWKNYVAVSGPQDILGAGLRLHHAKWGFLRISGSWQSHSFVRLNPERYTKEAVYLISKDEPRWKQILNQEELPAYFLINATLGHKFHFRNCSFGFLNKAYWMVQIGVHNLLNRQGYILSGYEQLRFDYDTRNPAYFPNKYTFGYGRTYYVSLTYHLW